MRVAGGWTLNPWSRACGGPTPHLTFYLCSDCNPIVSKSFTAIFLHPVLLLDLYFDGLANVLVDQSLYPVWTRGPRLALPPKKVFRAQSRVSIRAGTREHLVRGQAHLLGPPA